MARFKVAVTDHVFPSLEAERERLRPLDAELVEGGCRTEDEVILLSRDADVVFVTYAPVTARVIESLEKARAIIRCGIGVDNIDMPAATRRGIMVANTTNYCIEEVADHTMALLLACARGLLVGNRTVRDGRWDLKGLEHVTRLSTQTLGLIGLGRIGSAVVSRALSFSLRVLAHDPYVAARVVRELGAHVVDLDMLLAESDYVSIHIPLTPDTRAMLGEESLRRMKPTAFLINVSRGGIVEQRALCRALEQGWIAGAALDVLDREPPDPQDPILKLPNLIVTPHSAWYSRQAREDLRRMSMDQVVSVLRGEVPYSLLNREVLENRTG
ncbi:MAG: C-terminal binding protein [Chloroflexi bacterium]|nr:C-terminal binding protein [Chloroflexota bacterium]